ncbi:two-component sensor kinase [Anopheles sinensis]|uniref:Two-component sensor kinase n=1 Tax=Anopheles sinensis TaxID=74873 RepID=A0A084VKH8_ANOSI|nr:two-component sensor kinase [Anopheles sinensis]
MCEQRFATPFVCGGTKGVRETLLGNGQDAVDDCPRNECTVLVSGRQKRSKACAHSSDGFANVGSSMQKQALLGKGPGMAEKVPANAFETTLMLTVD